MAQRVTLRERAERQVPMRVRDGFAVVASDAEPEYLGAIRVDPCAYCDGRSETLDHIEPIRRAPGFQNPDTSLHGWWNLTPACRPCNHAKGSGTLLRFLLRVAA